MAQKCVLLLALGAGHALRTPSRVTMSTLEKTKPRAPVTKTKALPLGSRNNVLKIPYTAPDKDWQPGERRREVERTLIHPYFRLGSVDDRAGEKFLGALRELFGGDWGLGVARSEVRRAEAYAQVALALAFLPALVPAVLLVPFVVLSRKALWKEAVADSMEEHGAAFAEARDAYRANQERVVERLVAAELGRTNPTALGSVAVTMATSQEGKAVVEALLRSEKVAVAEVRAFVRDPESPKARALAALDARVTLAVADSCDASSLAKSLRGCDAAYLCTTLNRASAGTWAMDWDGGAYEIAQGEAFATACARLERLEPGRLKQVVYGTAPLRKWPGAFVVEPPIHYAAKWEIEALLVKAGVPLTCLRKCPYHENFTKLTVSGAGKDGVWRPGAYAIKALTPPEFVYNMLDPRDIGPWASIAFANPFLVGESLSIASDCLSGEQMADDANRAGLGEGAAFSYKMQPRLLFEMLAFVEPTFVYISGLQRWNSDGGAYDLDAGGVKRLRALHDGGTWKQHLETDGLDQFTETMADLLPTSIK